MLTISYKSGAYSVYDEDKGQYVRLNRKNVAKALDSIKGVQYSAFDTKADLLSIWRVNVRESNSD